MRTKFPTKGTMTFEEVHANYRPFIEMLAAKIARGNVYPAADFISRMNEHLWIAFDKFVDGGDCTFNTYVELCLRSAIRKQLKTYRAAIRVKDFTENTPFDIEVHDVQAGADQFAELDVIEDEKEIKRIVSYLRGEADDEQLSYMDGLLDGHSLNSIARKFEVQTMRVSRKLKQLAKCYTGLLPELGGR